MLVASLSQSYLKTESRLPLPHKALPATASLYICRSDHSTSTTPVFGVKDLYVHGQGFVITREMAREVDIKGTINGVPVDLTVRTMALEWLAAQPTTMSLSSCD